MTIEVKDPSVPEIEKPRLQSLSAQILDLFEKENVVSNFELAKICIRYSARIFDLRKKGYNIEKVSQNHLTGETKYRLVR